MIDGNLDEWKQAAHHDGVWDIYRLRHASWYDGGARNRLTDQAPEEPALEDDLRARYYMAWDETYLYFGAEVHDNVNDVDDPDPAPRPLDVQGFHLLVHGGASGTMRRNGLGEATMRFAS